MNFLSLIQKVLKRQIHIKIYNRWGELIFVSQDLNFGWDGTSGMFGYKSMDGVYTWKISFKDQKTNERKVLIGHVTLIR